MIRGINREIIEIGDTGNMYFEKAFLFIRPGINPQQSKNLAEEGRRLVGNLSPTPQGKHRTKPYPIPLIVAISGILGGIFTYLVMMMM